MIHFGLHWFLEFVVVICSGLRVLQFVFILLIFSKKVILLVKNNTNRLELNIFEEEASWS